MNITTGTVFPNTWRRIKLQHVSLAAGLALAASVAIAAWPNAEAPNGAPASAGRPASAASLPQPLTVFYIVGSQAEAATLEVALATSGQEVAQARQTRVIVADPADEASRLQLSVLFAEQAHGVLQNTQAIDLRQP